MLDITLWELLRKNLPDRAGHPALIDGERAMSYSELVEQAETIAGFLASRGIGRGDRVAVHLHKCVEEVVAMLAAARLGAVIVNVASLWNAPQLEHVLNDCGVAVLFTGERRAAELARATIPRNLRLIVVLGESPDPERMVAWAAIPSGLPSPVSGTIDADLAAIVYTSGSSGRPKGVMLTHLNLIQCARGAVHYLENRPEDRLLSLLPFSFGYGLSQLTTMFLAGGTLVLQKVMMPAEIVRTLGDQRITGLAGVPTTWVSLARFLEEAPSRFPELRYVTNAGGKAPDGVLARLPRLLPGVKIILMYGLTEVLRSTCLEPAMFEKKRGSMGRAVPGAEVFVINEKGELCGPGEIGELVQRGSLLSLGYWGDAEATRERFRPCPALRHCPGDDRVCWSGDLVRTDADGYLWFVGRADDMIKSSGFRLSPTEVEDVVSRSGLVHEAVAVGLPDDVLGQAVELVVTIAPGLALDAASLLRFCRDSMPAYMQPRRIHLWPGELPRLANAKLDRRQIVRWCESRARGTPE